jgi:hypothetical protein
MSGARLLIPAYTFNISEPDCNAKALKFKFIGSPFPEQNVTE